MQMQLQKQKESQKLVIKYLRDSINSLIKKKNYYNNQISHKSRSSLTLARNFR